MGTPAETRIADRVDKLRAELGIPLTKLAEDSHIARTTLQRLIVDGDEFTVKQLKAVSQELGVPFLSWFEDAA